MKHSRDVVKFLRHMADQPRGLAPKRVPLAFKTRKRLFVWVLAVAPDLKSYFEREPEKMGDHTLIEVGDLARKLRNRGLI